MDFLKSTVRLSFWEKRRIFYDFCQCSYIWMHVWPIMCIFFFILRKIQILEKITNFVKKSYDFYQCAPSGKGGGGRGIIIYILELLADLRNQAFWFEKSGSFWDLFYFRKKIIFKIFSYLFLLVWACSCDGLDDLFLVSKDVSTHHTALLEKHMGKSVNSDFPKIAFFLNRCILFTCFWKNLIFLRKWQVYYFPMNLINTL